jgi:hypothetical protein
VRWTTVFDRRLTPRCASRPHCFPPTPLNRRPPTANRQPTPTANRFQPPTARAENSNTARHLAEFWMIEPEMAFADLEDDMACAEAYLKHCTK